MLIFMVDANRTQGEKQIAEKVNDLLRLEQLLVQNVVPRSSVTIK